jgi:hypothetical protein
MAYFSKPEDIEALTAEATFNLSWHDTLPSFRMLGKSTQHSVTEGTKDSTINVFVLYFNKKSSSLSFFPSTRWLI